MKANILIAFSIFLAYVLSVIQMPEWVRWVRPEFTLLVLLYWTLAAPERCGIFVALVVGLFQDSITGTVLGQHMLAYVLVVTIVIVMHKRLRMYDVWHQAMVIFLLLLLSHAIENWAQWVAIDVHTGYWFLAQAMIGAFLWPWLMVSLRGYRRQAGLTNRF